MAGILTPQISQSFYGNVNALCKRLNDQESPRIPENYRGKTAKQHGNPDEYTLTYEEELHLADHFAFLAHVSEGVEFVSAVTIEESQGPPSFTVRLASNHTPTPYVREGIEKILQIVRDHALEGRNRVEYTSRLFDEVVNFSRKRIYARLRCSLWEKPAYTSGSNPPLYKQVRKRLLGLGAGSLKSALVNLIESLQKVDSTSVESRMDSLKDVIHKSHAVSHHAGSKSLENALCRLGVDNSICQSREVLEIDKLSRYLELCNDLVRLSRQPTTRRLYRDMKLEICTSYPGSQPPGALVKCFVHGEIQLILFYEQYPKQPLPRAIGSSKSACFLCDLFVKEHGGFGISYSHMKLYPKWTIPEVPWMNAAQIQRFRDIIETMDSETKQLLKKKFYHCNTVMESRAHILQIVQRSEIASSVASPAASQPRLIKGREIQMPGIDSVASALSLTGDKTTTTLYYFQDLPISVKILVGTISCTLLVGKVDYVFDLSEVDIGQLLVSECSRDETIPDELRVDIRNLSSSPHYLNGGASQNITFYLHDAEKHELRALRYYQK